VELLLACPTVSDRGTRHSSLIPDLRSDFELELGIALDLVRSDRDRVEVVNLVRACLDHQRGMELLVRSVGVYEKGTTAFARLERFMEELVVPGVVDWEAMDRLLAILPDDLVSDATARRLYYRSVGRFGPPLMGAPDLREVVEQLADLTPQVGEAFPYPLLAFVERLAHHAKKRRVRHRLQGWVRSATTDLGLKPSLYRRLQREVAEEWGKDARPYLLVQLKPSALNREGAQPAQLVLHVQAWLMNQQAEPDLRFNQEESSAIEGGTIEAVGSALDDWLRRVANLVPDGMLSSLVVEFLLPRELLCYPVDQWPVVADERIGMQVKVGEKFQVVVREVDRFQNREARHYWQKKWEHSQAFQSCPGCRAIHWVADTSALDRRQFYLELLHAEHRTCVGLPYLPPDATAQQDPLLVSLSAGVPVALWLRRRFDDLAPLQRDIDAELAQAGLTHLPNFVLRQRAEAGSQDDHVGSHLALLWDDPDRLPPVPQALSAPGP
jgi:hypothetical protein